MYELSGELEPPHSEDARVLKAFQVSGEPFIASGGRDRNIWIWKLGEVEGSFRYLLHSHLQPQHSGFVVSLELLDVSGDVVSLASGSFDSKVYIWKGDEKIGELTGHKGPVSAIGRISDTDIITGSLDKTALIWRKVGGSFKPIKQLDGHTEGIWDVLVIGSYIFTASADKYIKKWNMNYEVMSILKGHTGCVRSLCRLDENQIISAGNDGLIIHWNIETDEKLRMISVDSFVYSVKFNETSGEVVAATEDCEMLIIKGDIVVQRVQHPSTVWDVEVGKNGDLISACSDGYIRTWTRDTARIADGKEQMELENKLLKSKRTALGIQDLEELQQPGTKDGQHKLVNNNGKQEVYEWSAGEMTWKKIGDVIGKGEDDLTINGKKYDYRFDIEVGEGGPTLPLGHNDNVNPYTSAQNFIHENELPQEYLEEIANFIIKNAKPPTIDTRDLGPWSRSRYIPGAESIPPGMRSEGSRSERLFLDMKRMRLITYRGYNAKGLLGKIKEFGSEMMLGSSLDDGELQFIEEALNSVDVPDPKFNYGGVIGMLSSKLTIWPQEKKFPIYDALRVLLLVETAVISSGMSSQIVALVHKDILLGEDEKCELCAVRALCNSFNHSVFISTLIPNETQLLEAIQRRTASMNPMESGHEGEKRTLVAFSDLVFNFIYSTPKGRTHQNPSVIDLSLRIVTDFISSGIDELVQKGILSLFVLCEKYDGVRKYAIESDISGLVKTCSSMHPAISKIFTEMIEYFEEA